MKLMLNGKEVTGMGHYVMAGDIKDATTETSHVLSGKDFYNNNGKQTGTMPNRGGVNVTLGAGESYPIPDGYHNGEGVVKAQDLASQTAGDAGAGNIDSGKTAWVNGAQVTGTSTKVDTSGATATAANIESGYTAWVKGSLISGSLVKGKNVAMGTIKVYQGAFANAQTISTPNLSFKPVGVVFLPVSNQYGDGADSVYSPGCSIAAIACPDYAFVLFADDEGNIHADDYYSSYSGGFKATYGNTSITITHSDYHFPQGATMFYIAWGE